MILKKIKKEELLDFYNSELYKNLTHIPLTNNRLKSYINNPFCQNEDCVLYLFLENNQLVCYRTLLHDELYNGQKIVWSSGSWTANEFRRKGLSSQLLDEIEKDYPQLSMIYTRSLASYHLYRKHKNFTGVIDQESKELHFNFNVLNKKLPQIFSLLLNRLWNQNKKTIQKNNKLTLSKLNQETSTFLNQQNQNERFPLSLEKLGWIINYPWISTDPEQQHQQIYDFSHIDQEFETNAFEVLNDNKVKGFLLRNIRHQTYFVHYVYYDSDQEASEIAAFIVSEIENLKLDTLIIRDKTIQKKVEKLKKSIFKRPYKNFLFIDNAILENNPNFMQRPVQHGVGEIVFT